MYVYPSQFNQIMHLYTESKRIQVNPDSLTESSLSQFNLISPFSTASTTTIFNLSSTLRPALSKMSPSKVVFNSPSSSSSSSSSSPSPKLPSTRPVTISSFFPTVHWTLICTLLLLWITSDSIVAGLRIRRVTSVPEICANVSDLTTEQLIACREQPQAVLAVSDGTVKGISECQEQFKNERWNCTPDASENMFNKTLQRGSQETAFFYAITSSGVVHSLSQTCRSGNITDCSCDRRMAVSSDRRGWKWGGCSDNIDYAMNFAKKFVDSPDEQVLKRKPDDSEAIMNLHNNRAGRLAVYRKMERKCRCHGISGSCEIQTCWRVLPSFNQVGAYLKEKYQKSVKIKKRRDTRRKGRKVDQVNEDDLVYIRRSPNYCAYDPNLGILGTSGRRCVKTNDEKKPDSCEHLCCGRGYNTQRIVKKGLCNCRFHWCCNVTCEPCEAKEELIYTCK